MWISHTLQLSIWPDPTFNEPLVEVPLPVYLSDFHATRRKVTKNKTASYDAVNLAIKPQMVRYKVVFQSLALASIAKALVFGGIEPISLKNYK